MDGWRGRSLDRVSRWQTAPGYNAGECLRHNDRQKSHQKRTACCVGGSEKERKAAGLAKAAKACATRRERHADPKSEAQRGRVSAIRAVNVAGGSHLPAS